MEKFKKLSRAEMKNVLGGVEGGGCQGCSTSGGCSNGTIGDLYCGGGDNLTICATCYCNGVEYYPCQVF